MNAGCVMWLLLAIGCIICRKLYFAESPPLLPYFNQPAGITETTEICITREVNR
jgi:hypothetical protein